MRGALAATMDSRYPRHRYTRRAARSRRVFTHERAGDRGFGKEREFAIFRRGFADRTARCSSGPHPRSARSPEELGGASSTREGDDRQHRSSRHGDSRRCVSRAAVFAVRLLRSARFKDSLVSAFSRNFITYRPYPAAATSAAGSPRGAPSTATDRYSKR